jgi:hypothetical protein
MKIICLLYYKHAIFFFFVFLIATRFKGRFTPLGNNVSLFIFIVSKKQNHKYRLNADICTLYYLLS